MIKIKSNQKGICLLFLIICMVIISGCSGDSDVPEIKCSCKAANSSEAEPPSGNDPYLLTCIYNGDLKAVKDIVSKHDLDEEKVPGAVMMAIKCNQPEILEWLLDNGWSANPEQYESALATAFKYNCTLVRILLEYDAELNKNEIKHWISDDYKRTALHLAIGSGKACMVKTVLECGLDADPGGSYYPPLMEAIHFSHKDMIYTDTVCRLLVEYDADPDEEGEIFLWGKRTELNPAEYLVKMRVPMSAGLLSFLISNGADADYKPDDLRAMVSPKDVLENKNRLLKKHPEIREDLVRNYLRLSCSTPEMPGDESYNEALLKAVDDVDIDLNKPLPGGTMTPLAMARKNHNKKLCELLIRYGAKK